MFSLFHLTAVFTLLLEIFFASAFVQAVDSTHSSSLKLHRKSADAIGLNRLNYPTGILSAQAFFETSISPQATLKFPTAASL